MNEVDKWDKDYKRAIIIAIIFLFTMRFIIFDYPVEGPMDSIKYGLRDGMTAIIIGIIVADFNNKWLFIRLFIEAVLRKK